MSINLSAIKVALQNFDKARWEYDNKYSYEEPIKEAAIELQICALELAKLLVWKDKLS